MPRFVDRDFFALAVTQNERTWGDLPELDDRTRRCVPQFEDAAHRSQARYLQHRRDRLVSAILETTDLPNLFWRHQYFRGVRAGVVLSTDEAVEDVRRELRRQLDLCKRRHWSARPSRIPELREALTFARFFRRHSKRLWLQEAA